MKEQLNEQLLDILTNYEESTVKEACRYSLMAPGKRVRPLLMLALIKDYGFDPYLGMDAAMALEMLQTYSLIHDDLPAMDDDDYRRGQLANHKVYGQATAILAGDGLLSACFETLATSSYTDKVKVQLIELFSRLSGINGMVLGQQQDLDYSEKGANNLEALLRMYELKTGCLLALSLEAAAILVGKSQDRPALYRIGLKCGRAFQIQDDIFDVTQTTDQLGKTTHSDDKKMTALHFMTLEEAEKLVNHYYSEIRSDLKSLNLAGSDIYELIEYLMVRKS